MIALRKYWWAMAAFMLLGLSSCVKNEPSRYTFSTLGVIQRSSQDSTVWWFMRDDSATFISASPMKVPQSLHRVIADIEMKEDIEQRNGYNFTVNFQGFAGVPTGPVTATSLTYIQDTAPKGQIWVEAPFSTLQYLNLNVFFKGYDGKKHKFYLLRDSLQVSEPVRLFLRHSTGGDEEYATMAGTISFDLETLAERNTQDSVRLRLITPVGDSMSFLYKFHK